MPFSFQGGQQDAGPTALLSCVGKDFVYSKAEINR